MEELRICQKCGREIKYEPIVRRIQKQERVYCSEHCYVLDFYGLPFSLEELKKCYEYFCIRIKAPDFKELDKRIESIYRK
ncbi:MAG: hypothetical protein ABIM21_04595 [candidate division WOR-3 bacterium]